MPAKKHSVEEIVSILREMERLTEGGMSIAAAAQSFGITDQTFYRWRARYGSLPEDEAKRLQLLNEENARLKRVIEEQSQDISMLRDLAHSDLLSAAQRREAVDYLVQRYRISERRACRLVGQHRSTQRYPTSDRSTNGTWWGSDLGRPAVGREWPRAGLAGGVPSQEWDEGPREEPRRPTAAATRIPFLDDLIPGFYRLRTSLVHDLFWLARDSEMARLVRTRGAVRATD